MEFVGPDKVLRKLGEDRSSWVDIQHYPDSLTERYMLRLGNFIAAKPERWEALTLRHYYGRTQAEIAEILGVSRSLVAEYLKPVNLAEPDDYPEEE